MQHYAESAITNSQFEFSMWRPIVRPDDLFLQFCHYCDEQREVKKWTSKAFQMCISKYLRIRADVRDHSNHGDKLSYNLGDSAEEFIATTEREQVVFQVLKEELFINVSELFKREHLFNRLELSP